MRPILINADDLNYTPGINAAIADLFEKEAISTTTAMMALADPHFPSPDFITTWGPKIGLHLQLTQGAPLTLMRRIDGRALQTFPTKDKVDTIDATGVNEEWHAQLNRFRNIFTTGPCRIDSHHGVHRDPRFAPIAQSMATTLDVPLRGNKTKADGLVWEWTGQYLKAEALAAMIKQTASQTPETTVIEVVVHPGWDPHELEGLDSWQACRENDHEELLRLKRDWDRLLPGFSLL